MPFSLELAIRYIRSKKRAFVSVGTMFAILGVVLGVAALTIVVSVTGGFLKEFQDKVLGVNAHVLVLKHSTDFREYREVIEKVEHVKGVTGVAPFVISPMMLTHGEHTATGVLLKGVDPDRMPRVLDLPKHIIRGSLAGLRRQGATPPKRQRDPLDFLGDVGDLDMGSSSLIIGDHPAVAPSANEGERGRNTENSEIETSKSTTRATAAHSGLIRAIKESRGKIENTATGSNNTHLDGAARAPAAEVATPGGSVEPSGGYKSLLPEEDILPPELVEDPCKIHSGQLGLPGIVIGKTLRENLHADLGDCIQVASPTIGYSVSGGVIRAPVAKQFQVVAVFDAGFDQI